MSFLETPRFPESIAFGAVGGPVWFTSTTLNMAGYRAAVANFSQSMHRYDVSHGLKTDEQMRELIAFFQAMRGRYHGFRFKDWSDYTVESGEGFFTTIDSTHRQLLKRYETGALTYDRDIKKPVDGSLTIAGSGTYTVDYTTGILTITSGSAPTGWTGEFDVPCVFSSDEMRITLEDYNGTTWGGIMIESIRV